MRERRCFVQFIHPGGEHSPDTADLKLWNRGGHRRKFLVSNGRYIADGAMKDGEIVFWGEWEPEAVVLRRYEPPLADGPRFLYEPYFIDHPDDAGRQNTDPFVFGEGFHYTGCLQHTRRGPTQLRYLAPGSIVLFGSCRARSRFVLDTLLVVAGHVDHSAADARRVLDGRISATYRAVTIDPWYSGEIPEGQSHRLYFGATPQRCVGTTFSFFPCQPHGEGGRGFARPEVRIPGRITPHLTQGKKIARDLTLATLDDLWRDVVRQVEEQELALGVYAELPRKRDASGEEAEHRYRSGRSGRRPARRAVIRRPRPGRRPRPPALRAVRPGPTQPLVPFRGGRWPAAWTERRMCAPGRQAPRSAVRL
jgi:hypothetical protein